MWKRAKMVTLPKPNKDPYNPKNSCIKLSVDYTKDIIEQQRTPVYLTQYTEDGFESKLKTGTVFVNLSAAYDPLNH